MNLEEQLKTMDDAQLLGTFMCVIEEMERRETPLRAATLWMENRLRMKLETQTKH